MKKLVFTFMDIEKQFASLNPNAEWLNQYLLFIQRTASPQVRPSMGYCHNHHILPRAMFPEYISLKKYPWNCKPLTPADHLIAHYYLYRALPQHPIAYLSFLKMCNRIRFNLLAQNGYSEDLLHEVSQAFSRICLGIDSINGWLHIYKGKNSHTIIPHGELERYIKLGWTQTAPPRQWVYKGGESYRILLAEIPEYLERGFTFGRGISYTEEFKAIISVRSKKQHRKERLKDDAYSYLPCGENHWAYGKECDEKTKDKISKSLTGRTLSPTHAAKIGIANKGKHWKWSEEDRQARSELMKGITPTNGLTMKGKTVSDGTRALMSELHKQFYANNPDAVAALDTARPRGENHVFFGKERNADTCAKIAATLTGKKQSEETKRKRAASLALAKMPDYTSEERKIFHSLHLTKDIKVFSKVAKALKRPAAKRVAAGLKIIMFRIANETNYRSWRQADSWLKSRS